MTAAIEIGATLRHHDGRTGTFICIESDGRYRTQSFKGKGYWIFHPDDCERISSPTTSSANPAKPEGGAVAARAQAVIRNGQIVISVDVDALPIILSGSIALNAVAGTFKVTDAATFAKEVCHALNAEKEDGTTRVHMMFDSAFNHAIDQGAEGVEEIGEDEFEAEANRLQEEAALTPRHEAPDWTAATEAAWAENNSHEAPAEGTGERDAIARIVSAGMVQERASVHGGGFMVLGLNMSNAAGPFDDWDDAHAKLVEIRTDAILALRARSSAPEAPSAGAMR